MTQQSIQNGGVDLWANEGPARGETGEYLDIMFARKAVGVIDRHKKSGTQQPLFLTVSWHNTPADEAEELGGTQSAPEVWQNPEIGSTVSGLQA